MPTPSYDRIGLEPEHVSHARRIIDAAGGRTVKNIERGLRDIHSFDNNVPRQVLTILRQDLLIAMRQEERERQRHWRPMR
jgi:hypothetical protein